jgi:response regulator RpfG family c-di-GMP phosphodiesterase
MTNRRRPLPPSRPAGLCSRVQTRIVLVDDDDLYREVMAADLEDHGYAVVGFADGAALLAAVQSGAEHKGQALQAGAVEFIDKTCGIDMLVQKLGRIVGQNP